MTLVKKPAPLKYARADEDALIDFANEQARNVKEAAYGASGDDTGNDAPAINTAVNDVDHTYGGIVYLPPGTYRLTSGITFPSNRQVRMIGAGPEATKLHVVSGTTAAPGIIHIQGSELRSSVENLQICFDQPDDSNRANLTHYVPAIYAQGIARFRVQHVRIIRAWDGIDMRQNSNAEIDDLEISHFNTGIQIDGSFDAIRISHLHDWVFGCTGNQMQALFHPSNTGIIVGKADGLTLADSLLFCGTGMKMINSVMSVGASIVNVTNCFFDSFNGLVFEAGNIRVGDSVFSTQPALGYECVRAMTPLATAVVGHAMQFNNCLFTGNTAVPTAVAFVNMIGLTSGGYLDATFTSCKFKSANMDLSSIRADATAGGVFHLQVDNNHFERDGNMAYTRPTLDFGVNVRAVVVNNLTRDKGTGPADFLRLATAAGIVDGNHLLGWGLNFFPGTQPYGGNNRSGVISGSMHELIVSQGYMQASGLGNVDGGAPPFAIQRYTGTLDGSGGASVIHGLGLLPQTGLGVHAWYKSAAGAMIPLTVGGIDNTQINVAGGVASAPYRVIIVYSSDPHAW